MAGDSQREWYRPRVATWGWYPHCVATVSYTVWQCSSVTYCVAVWKWGTLCGTLWPRRGALNATIPLYYGTNTHNRRLLKTQQEFAFLFVYAATHIEKQTICKNLKKFQDRQTNSPNISSLLLKITLRKYVLSDKVYVLVINVSQDDPTPLIGEVSHFKCEAVGTNLEQSQLQQMHSLPLIVCTWVLFRLHITMWKYFFDRLVLILSYTEADNHDAAKPEPDHQMYLARYFF